MAANIQLSTDPNRLLLSLFMEATLVLQTPGECYDIHFVGFKNLLGEIIEFKKEYYSLGNKTIGALFWHAKRDEVILEKMTKALEEDLIHETSSLLKQGADINYTENDIAPPLIAAINFNLIKVANFLLSKGADLEKIHQGKTPIFDVKSTEMAKLLVDAKANIEFQYGGSGTTPLRHMLDRQDSTLFKFFVDCGANVHIKDKDNYNLIFRALIPSFNSYFLAGKQLTDCKNIREILEILIKEKLDINEIFHYKKNRVVFDRKVTCFHGYSPLMLACAMGHEEIVDFLISKGARINQSSKRAENPLIHRKTWNFNTLYPGFPSEDIEEFTPLLAAVASNNINIVKSLVALGANLNHVTPKGWYAYRMAYLRFLSDPSPELTFIQNFWEMGSIVEFSENDRRDYIALRGLSNVNIEPQYEKFFNKQRWNHYLFSYARRLLNDLAPTEQKQLHEKIAHVGSLLLKNWITLGIKTLDGLNTPLHLAIQLGHLPEFQRLSDFLAMHTSRQKVDILCAQNKEGHTILDCAVNFTDPKIDPKIKMEMVVLIRGHILSLIQELYKDLEKIGLNRLPVEMVKNIYRYRHKVSNGLFAKTLNGQKQLGKIFHEASICANSEGSGASILAEKYLKKGLDHMMKSFGKESNKEYNPAKALVCFYKSARMGNIKAMQNLALMHVEGAYTPQNIELAKNIVRKIRALGFVPDKTLQEKIEKIRLDSQSSPKAIMPIENNKITEKEKAENKKNDMDNSMFASTPLTLKEHEDTILNHSSFVKLDSDWDYDAMCDYRDNLNLTKTGPCRTDTKLESEIQWQNLPYFITNSDIYSGAYNVVIFFYIFKKIAKTKQQAIDTLKFSFIETLIRPQNDFIDVVDVDANDEVLLIERASYSTLEKLLDELISTASLNKNWNELTNPDNPTSPNIIISVNELLIKKQSAEQYLANIYEPNQASSKQEITSQGITSNKAIAGPKNPDPQVERKNEVEIANSSNISNATTSVTSNANANANSNSNAITPTIRDNSLLLIQFMDKNSALRNTMNDELIAAKSNAEADAKVEAEKEDDTPKHRANTKGN